MVGNIHRYTPGYASHGGVYTVIHPGMPPMVGSLLLYTQVYLPWWLFPDLCPKGRPPRVGYSSVLCPKGRSPRVGYSVLYPKGRPPRVVYTLFYTQKGGLLGWLFPVLYPGERP